MCGRHVEPNEYGNMVLDVEQTLLDCLDEGRSYLVETKYNGHRGILEYDGSDAVMYSEKKANKKPLPDGISQLASDYLSGNLDIKPKLPLESAILDGEIFLKECDIDGMRVVPEIPVQVSAIKGKHPELYDKCNFSYKVFDLININGGDVTHLSLLDRKRLLNQILPNPVMGKLSDYVSVKDERGDDLVTGENLFIEQVQGDLLMDINDIHQKFCDATNAGHEGLVIKDPHEEYEWEGKDKPARKGWKKLKEEFTVNASVKKACLGSWHGGIKTTRHLARYKDLILSTCIDKECNDEYIVARSGLNTQGGPISGWDDWDEMIHYPMLGYLESGVASPSKGEEYRLLKKIKAAVRRKPKGKTKLKDVHGFKKMEKMMGCNPDGSGCMRNKKGDIALPKCIDIPSNKVIAEVVTTEINMHDGVPHLGGPPRVIRVREDKEMPDTMDYLKRLYAQETGN